MKKRGQIGQVIKYLLIALVIVITQIFGYKAFVMVREKMCQTEIADFEVDLKGLEEGIGFGSVDEKTLLTPCNVDEIYFFDLDGNISLDIFNKLPILRDSLESGVKKNLFLIKDDKVKRSFYSGNLDIEYPYFECLVPQNDRINFFLEGAGKAVKVIPGCNQLKCSYIPEVLGLDKADAIAESINFRGSADCVGGAAAGCDVSSIEIEVIKTIETMSKVDIFRQYQYCPDSGIARVELLIKPKKGKKVEEFRLFEYIPKDCLGDLDAVLAETLDDTLEYNVEHRSDPLIMWYFENLEGQKKVSYEIKTRFDEEDCKKVIDSIGIADWVADIDKGEILTEVDSPSYNLGTEILDTDFTLTDVQELTAEAGGGGGGNAQPTIITTPLTTATVGLAYNYDVDANDPDGDTLTYSLITPPSPAAMSISSTTGEISWTPSSAGSYNVEVEVTDGITSPITQSFSIAVSPSISLELSITDITLSSGLAANYNNVLLGSLTTKVSGGSPPYISFVITSQEDTSIVDCSIGIGEILDCTVPTTRAGNDGVSEIEIEVEDSLGVTDTDHFDVTVPCAISC